VTAPRRRPSRARRAALQLTLLLGGLLALEALLAVYGVRPLADTEDPFVGFSNALPLFVERASPDGPLMVTAPGKISLFNEQSFLKDKPAGTVRIVTIGGSTTYGHPYDDRLSYSAWMREMLAAAQPGTRFEVINCGGISYASYRDANLVEQLCAYEPDAFIIYSGPNEFLEDRTYPGLAGGALSTLGSWLARTRTFTLARRAVDGLRDAPDMRAQLPAEVQTRLGHVAGLELYSRDDALRTRILEHYRANLARMVRLAHAAGARIVLVAPASELRDCAPFKSQPGEDVPPAARAEVDGLLDAARSALAAGHAAEALSPAARAAALDPRRALARYVLGESLFATGRHAEARAALEAARDEDVCPLRPLTVMRDLVREVAADEGAGYLDFVAAVDDECERRFGHRVPGHEQFLDHVHLDLDGYELLARRLLDALAEQGVVTPAPGWEAALPALEARVRARLDAPMQGIALRNLAKTLDWAGKSEEAARLARQALDLLGTDAESSFALGSFALQEQRWDEAAAHFRDAVQADPQFAAAWLDLAHAEQRAGHPAEALEALDRTLLMQPDQGQALSLRALLRDEAGRGDEAVADARRSAELLPNDPLVANNLGLVLAHAGRLDEAAAAFAAAVRLDPGHVKSRLNLARLRLRQGRHGEAAEQLRAVLALQPDDAEARALLAAAEAP